VVFCAYTQGLTRAYDDGDGALVIGIHGGVQVGVMRDMIVLANSICQLFDKYYWQMLVLNCRGATGGDNE